MTISQTTFVREILLVRPTAAGSWAGHQKKITVTTGAPFPIPEHYGEAEPLDMNDLGDVLDAIVVDVLAERDAVAAALDIANATIADRDAALTEAQGQITSLTGHLADQADEIAALQAQLVVLNPENLEGE